MIAKWTVYPVRGVGPLRNEKPRMGVRGSLGEGGMNGLLGGYFSEQGSEGESGGLGDDPVSE